MSIFDISLLIILGGFIVNGLFKGLIRIIGNIIGLFAGAWIASHYYLTLYAWGAQWANGHDNVAKVLAFIILFVVASRLIDFIFFLVEKLFNLVAIIPGSKYINNLLGAGLGFLEGALFLGLIIYVISRYTLIGNFFGDQLTQSIVAPWLLKIVTLISPFLPQALKALTAII